MHKNSQKVPAGLTRCLHIFCSILLLSLCVSPVSFGQILRIRIVNAMNESPLKNQKVSISGISGKSGTDEEEKHKLLAKPTTPDLRLLTDANGEAQFELPEPAPPYFNVRAELSARLWDCTCLVRVSTEKVMQEGFNVKAGYKAKADSKEGPLSKPSIQPKPGEILFRLLPTPPWLRVLWPLLPKS